MHAYAALCSCTYEGRGSLQTTRMSTGFEFKTNYVQLAALEGSKFSATVVWATRRAQFQLCDLLQPENQACCRCGTGLGWWLYIKDSVINYSNCYSSPRPELPSFKVVSILQIHKLALGLLSQPRSFNRSDFNYSTGTTEKWKWGEYVAVISV